jgi:hypothetical protein
MASAAGEAAGAATGVVGRAAFAADATDAAMLFGVASLPAAAAAGWVVEVDGAETDADAAAAARTVF